MDDCPKRAMSLHGFLPIDQALAVVGLKEHLADQCLICCDADRKLGTPDRNLGGRDSRRHRNRGKLTVGICNLDGGASALLRSFGWVYQGCENHNTAFFWKIESVIEYQLNAVRSLVQGALFSKAFGRAPLESEQGFFFHLCRNAVVHGF